MPQLDGEIAVITGGSSGIGQGVCHRLAQEGARIAVMDILPPDDTKALLPAGHDVWFHHADLSDPDAIEAAFAQLERDWATPRVLVNVAGVFNGLIPFLDITPEMWDRELDVNARGLYFCSQSAARRMRHNGGGRIVNILSTAAAQGFALASSYCASKGAALLITRALAIELAQYDILVNGVGPGTIQAPTSSSYLAESEISEHELSRIPLARFGEPSDIAEAVAFLATRATWLTGQAIYVDGGFMAAGLPYLPSLPTAD